MNKRFHPGDLLLTVALTSVLVYALSFTLVIEYSFSEIFRPALVLTAVIGLFFAFPITAAFAGGAVALAFAGLFFSDQWYLLEEFYHEFVYWSYHWVEDPLMNNLVIWALTAAVTFPVFLLVRYKAPAPIIFSVGMVLFYGMEILGAEPPGWLFWIFLLLCLFVMLTGAQIFRRGAGWQFLCSVPICVLVIALAYGAGYRDVGLGEGVIQWFASQEGPFGKTKSPFASVMTAMGEELGGSYSPSGRTMLTYRPRDNLLSSAWSDLSSPPYLRGGVGQAYDGRRWQPPKDTEEVNSPVTFEDPVRRAITQLILSGFHLSHSWWGDANMADVLFNYQIGYAVVTHRDLISDRLYVPPEAVELNVNSVRTGNGGDALPSPAKVQVSGDDENLLLTEGTFLSREGGFDENVSYWLRTAPKWSSTEQAGWERFLLAGIDGGDAGLAKRVEMIYNETMIETILQTFLPDDSTINHEIQITDSNPLMTIIQSWIEEGERAREAYLQIPDSMPQRVHNLARSIAAYDSDYANAVAIERYLSSHFPYEMDMPATPAGRDFVDYFLFEAKKGYCTYFATAMVMLCRSAGIPARYVEGFAPTDTVDEGSFIYKDNQAHAWAEAYIDGFGWISFEPTAGYSSPRSANLPALPTSTPEPGATPSPTPEASPTPTPSTNPSADISPTPEGGIGGNKKESEPLPSWLVSSLYILGFLVVVFILRILLNWRRQRFLDSLEAVPYRKETVQAIRRHVLSLLVHAGLTIKRQETLGETAARAQVIWTLEGDKMNRLFALFGRGAFGQDALDEGESYELMELTLEFERYARVNLSKPRFWWYRKIIRKL